MTFKYFSPGPSPKGRDLGRGFSTSGGGRIQSFDLARGFTVLLMPSIHVCMLYSTIPVQQSLLGDILGFIAEGPGAQLFMLLMGVNFALKMAFLSPKGEGSGVGLVLKRSFYLFFAAYLLNFFKFILPLGLGILPENLLAELGLKNDFAALHFFMLIGDILHFAAIAYIILYGITRLKHYPIISFIVAIAIMLLAPHVWDLQTGIAALDHVIVLFNGHPPQTFFPVFPWLVYPLMGLTLGHLLRKYDPAYILRKCALAGATLIILSLMFPATTTISAWLPFYRTEPPDTIFHLGFVLLWLALFQWLSKRGLNPFFRLLTFCSRHITAIYLIQWILICWCMAFTGYLQLNLFQTVCWMAGITTVTLLLTYKINRAKPIH